jgi:4'-phosphopantetheinyl transferase
VHVWTADLDSCGLQSAEMRGVLSPDERRSARAIPDKLLRQRYLARKTFQRLVLADYLRIAPQRISFSKDIPGKPGFASALRAADLRFSASNSGSVGVLAVARAVRVGIDIEAVRPIAHLSDVAGWLGDSFDAGETNAESPDGIAFFRQWTRLEARVKCSGLGLARHDRTFGSGWNLKTVLHHCAGERFLFTLATRHSCIRVQGPFMLDRLRLRSGGRRMPGRSAMHLSRRPQERRGSS